MMPKAVADTSIRPRPDFEQLRKVLLRNGRPEYIPSYELFVNPEVQEELLGKPMPDRASTIEFYFKLGYDYVPCWPVIDLELGDLVDRRLGYPIKDWESFESFRWPRPESISYEEFEAVAPLLPEGMKIIGQTAGIFEAAQSLLGYEQLCFLLLDDAELVEAVFARLSVLYESMYGGMAEIEQVGALVISDDMGFKTQTLIGPDDIRRYILPRHKRLAELAHEAGKPCILHSCGQLSAVMDELIEQVGIDAKHSFEDAIQPVTEAYREYGDRIAILGGFDVDRLCRSSEQEIRAHTRMLIEQLGSRGGYAFGSGNSIPPFVPAENYLTMLDEAWRLR